MRTWLWTILLLALAVALALLLKTHGGNVLIVAPPWRVEMSLTLAVLLLLAIFLVAHVTLRIIYWFSGSPERFRLWRGRRAEKRDAELLESGWIGMMEGRYDQAQKEFQRLLDRTKASQRKVLAALALARAAHDDAAYERRDEALERARQAANDPRLREATAIAAAEMLLDEGRAQEALGLLQPIQDATSLHVNATRLLLRAHRQLGNFDQVYELTRLLSRRGGLVKSEAQALIETSAAARLRAAGDDGYKAVWSDLKSEERVLPGVAFEAAAIQTAKGNHEDAAKILQASLDVSLDPQLLAVYAQCPPEHVAKRLNKAEGWLKSNPENPDLLAALGNLCLTGQLWGQGERYLQRSMRIRSDARVHALLGSLYDRLGRSEDAARHWRLASGVAGALPVLAADSLLPAADTRQDPARLEAEIEDELTDEQAAVAGAHTAFVEGLPEEMDTAAKPVPVEQRPEDDSVDDYFDSAPIPGVDVEQTSDRPSSGSHKY